MSTEIYRPNGPNTEPSYEIGTEGRELFPVAEGSGVFNTFLNIARSIYKNVTGFADIIVPTYGLNKKGVKSPLGSWQGIRGTVYVIIDRACEWRMIAEQENLRRAA